VLGNQYQSWSKEEIIKAIQEFYKINQRTPRSNDFCNRNNLPSYMYTCKILNCSIIEDIFSLCNLVRSETTYNKKIDKEWAIKQLKKYYHRLNRIPTRDDFKKYNLPPYYDYYRRYFGNYNNACYLAEIIDKPLSDEEKIHISIETLINLANVLQRCPMVQEYESIEQKGYERRTLERKLNMKYNNICRKYIPQYIVNINRDYTQDELKDILFNLKDKLGRSPMSIELKTYNLPSYGVFQRKFNMSYNKIIESFGWEPVGLAIENRSEEKLLDDFMNLFKELKRVPYLSDFSSRSNIASYTTYKKYFKSIENVCKLLGIDYELYYKGAGAGKICLDNNGGLCKSLIERDISNFLIANNITFEKGSSYSELIDGDKRQFDWKFKINNIPYYIEYAGMYHRKPRGGIDMRYTKKIKKKIKDLYKHGYFNQCLFIFPWDIKNRSLSDIFNFALKTSLIDIPYTYDNQTIEYGRYTEQELLNNVMKYSSNENLLPSTTTLVKEISGLYSEILKRYKSYFNFSVAVNKQILMKPGNYWTEENAFDKLIYMLNTYSSLKYSYIKNDLNLRGMGTAIHKFGWVNLKLLFFEYCVNNNIKIPNLELKWIHNMVNNIGKNIKNRISIDNQKMALSILNKINLSLSA